jgi:hypothetical protein
MKLRPSVEARIPIYRFRLVMAPVGSTEKSLAKHKLLTREVEFPEATDLATCQKVGFKTGGMGILLFLPSKRHPSTTLHECIHAAHMVLDMVGIDIDPEDDEALAYLVEWLVNMVDFHFYKRKVDFYK